MRNAEERDDAQWNQGDFVPHSKAMFEWGKGRGNSVRVADTGRSIKPENEF